MTCGNEKADLEDFVVANPDLLAGDQMAGDDEEPYRWMLIKQQMPVESASSGEEQLSLDLLYVDQFAWLTFVECKLRSNAEAYRKVVGQMLEYVASAQHYWTEAKLRKYVTPAGLESLAASAGSVEEFCKQAIDNLKAGKVRLVFLLDEAPSELKSIARFLNEQLSEVEVFVLELRHFQDQERRFVMPLVFGYSEEAMARRREAAPATGIEPFRAALMQSADSDQERAAFKWLLQFCEPYPQHWGRGKTPSCSVVLPCSAPKSAITVWYNGDVTLNLDYLPSTAADTLRSSLQQGGIAFNTSQKFPGVKKAAWVLKVTAFMAALEVVAESTATGS